MPTGLRIGLLLVGILVLASASGGAMATADPLEHPSVTTSPIQDVQVFSLAPDHPGEITVEHEYQIPDRVSRFEVHLTERMTLIQMEGFTYDGENTLKWDESTTNASLTYRVDIDRTIDREGPLAQPGQYLFKDGDDWALFQRPNPGYSWGWSGNRVGIDRTAETDGPGAVSEVMGFLGEHDTHTHEAHGQTFTLIEPTEASLAETPDAIFQALEHASDHLRVEDRDEHVFMIAAPSDDIDWGVRGLQAGSADIWVSDAERLDSVWNVWVHEYIHARQGYSTDDSARWFAEGSATYYAALFAYETGAIEYDTLEEFLAGGDRTRYRSVHLDDPSTWRDHAEYRVGPLVIAALDRDLRHTSGGAHSFIDVFRGMNEHEGEVTHEAIISLLARHGSPAIAESGDRYLSTTDRPRTWDESTHLETFGTPPARFSFQLADDKEIRVTGPYRDRVLTSDAPHLVNNETLLIPIEVTNRGETAGTFTANPLIGPDRPRTVDGHLGPGESTVITISHDFTSIGSHPIRLDETRLEVIVYEPASPTVADIDVSPQTAEVGEMVMIRVLLQNDAPIPAASTVIVLGNEDPLFEATVQLDTKSNTLIEDDVTFDEAGTVEISVKDVDIVPIQLQITDPNAQSVPSGNGLIVGLASVFIGTVLISMWALKRRFRTGATGDPNE